MNIMYNAYTHVHAGLSPVVHRQNIERSIASQQNYLQLYMYNLSNHLYVATLDDIQTYSDTKQQMWSTLFRQTKRREGNTTSSG